MNFSDDCPDDGAALSNAKPLRAALLWHRSRWLNLIPCNTLWCQGSLGVFAIIWIYSLICHLSWDFSLSSYIYHCILQFSNQSFLEIVCNHHLELKTLQLFLFFYRHGICFVQRDALRACSAGSFGGDGGVWANITQRQDSCAQKIWRGAKKNNEAGFENFESHPSNQSLCLQTMCEKLEKEVDSRLTIRAERLWSFRFCDSVSRQYLNFNHESWFGFILSPIGVAAFTEERRVPQQHWPHCCSCTRKGTNQQY